MSRIDLSRGWRRPLLGVVVVAAVLAPGSVGVLRRSTSGAGLGSSQLEAASPQAGRGRLVVLGLDALDWKLVDQLMARGLMPNLRHLADRGAQAVIDVPAPLISPVVWTTYATGVAPEVHGVLDFLEEDPRDGSLRPVGSASRKVPAMWEMAAALGRRSGVIGWWATFPAHAPPGCAIYSDRLTEQLIGLEADTPGIAAPADAAATARDLLVRASDITAQMLAPYLEVEQQEMRAAQAGEASWDDPVGGLAKLVAATMTVERLTDHELERGTDIILSYLEGTDTVGHLFGAYRPPPLAGVSPTLARRFGGVPDRYYAHVDAWIGRVVAKLADRDTVVILSDHGFTWGKDRPPVASGAHTATAVWWHRPEGAFLAAGPAVRHTPSRQRIGVLDVTPILLALAGLPPGQGMPGSVPDWLWSVAGRAQVQPEAVDYARLIPERHNETVELPPQAREEEMAKLRALGYVAGTPQEGKPEADRAEARRLNNLGSSRYSAGDVGAAEEAFREAIAADASYAPAHYNLSLLYRKQGRLDRADREFWEAVQTGIADREMAVVRLALDYRQRGDTDHASQVFQEGRRRFPRSAVIWLNSGVFLGERERYREAVECLRRAVDLDASNPKAHANLAVALLATGDRDGARKALTAASRLDPADENVRQELERLGGPPPE